MFTSISRRYGRKNLPVHGMPLGIQNNGHYSYVNSLLQALSSIPLLRKKFSYIQKLLVRKSIKISDEFKFLNEMINVILQINDFDQYYRTLRNTIENKASEKDANKYDDTFSRTVVCWSSEMRHLVKSMHENKYKMFHVHTPYEFLVTICSISNTLFNDLHHKPLKNNYWNEPFQDEGSIGKTNRDGAEIDKGSHFEKILEKEILGRREIKEKCSLSSQNETNQRHLSIHNGVSNNLLINSAKDEISCLFIGINEESFQCSYCNVATVSDVNTMLYTISPNDIDRKQNLLPTSLIPLNDPIGLDLDCFLNCIVCNQRRKGKRKIVPKRLPLVCVAHVNKIPSATANRLENIFQERLSFPFKRVLQPFNGNKASFNAYKLISIICYRNDRYQSHTRRQYMTFKHINQGKHFRWVEAEDSRVKYVSQKFINEVLMGSQDVTPYLCIYASQTVLQST